MSFFSFAMENHARAYQQIISIQILKLRNLCFRQVALAFRLHNKIDYGLQNVPRMWWICLISYVPSKTTYIIESYMGTLN